MKIHTMIVFRSSIIFSILVLSQIIEGTATPTSTVNKTNVTKRLERSLKHNGRRIEGVTKKEQYPQKTRNLQGGDLEDFNELLDGLVIALPDAKITEDLPWPLTALILTMTNIKCSHISVNKVDSSQKKDAGNARVDFFFNILGLTIECELDWRYEIRNQGIWDKGTAVLSAKNGENYVQGYFELYSEQGKTFNTHPPISTDVGNCKTNIEISSIKFDSGGMSADILKVFEKTLRKTVEKELEDIACDELSKLDESIDEAAIKRIYDSITPYFTLENVDPLYAEKYLVSSDEKATLVDWTGENSLINAIKNGLEPLGSISADSETGDVLGISSIIQSLDMYDEEIGGLLLNVEDIPTDDEENRGVILDMHDMLTETTISWTQMRVFGLDTFNQFDVMNALSPYTIQNVFELKELDVEIDLTVDIKPSSRESSLIVTGTAPRVVERITLKTGFRNLSIEMSMLLALDAQQISNLKLGSLFDQDQIMKCLLSTIWKMEITQLIANAESIIKPTIDGFIDSGLDDVVNTGAQVAMTAYNDSILRALPGIFQSKLRVSLNKMIENYFNDPGNVSCPALQPSLGDGFIDLRDLLLNPADAISAGGSGLSPYGDIFSKVKSIIDDMLVEYDPATGLSKINEAVITPITVLQSGIPGTYLHSEDLFTLQLNGTTSGMINAGVRIHNARVKNVDSLSQPLELLQPKDSEPFIVDNGFAIGTHGKSLIVSTNVLISNGMSNKNIESDETNLGDLEEQNINQSNEIEFSVEIKDAQVLADFMFKMDIHRFENLSVSDMQNPYCWLATIPAPSLDNDGKRIYPSSPDMASLVYFAFYVRQAKLGLECISCTSAGFEELPTMLSILEASGTTEEIIDRSLQLLIARLNDEWPQRIIDQALHDASGKCRYGAAYESAFLNTNAINLFLSREAVELGVFYSLVLGEVLMAVVSINHNNELDTVQNKFYLRRLDKSSKAESHIVVEKLFDYLGGTVNDPERSSALDTAEDLAINVMLRSMILDKDGIYHIDLKSLSMSEGINDIGEMSIEVTQFKIFGLDSITMLNIFEISDSDQIEFNVNMSQLRLSVEFAVRMGSSALEIENGAKYEVEVFTVDIEMKNIAAAIGLFLSFNMDDILKVPLGSIMHSKNIFPCILSAISELFFSKLSIKSESIGEPGITGFISTEIENAIKAATGALHEAYEKDMVKALPGIANLHIRKVLNKLIKDYLSNPVNTNCPPPEINDLIGSIDFRDLLMDTDDAFSAGGQGNAPYGDIPFKFKQVLDDIIQSIDPLTGLSQINELVIRPITESQSGIPGTLLLNDDLLFAEFNSTLLDVEHAEIRIYNARFDNLDNIGEPLQLFEPHLEDPYIINNEAMFGSNSGPFQVFTQVKSFLKVNDSNVTKVKENEMEIGIKIWNVHIFAAFMAQLDAKKLLSLSLNDAMNPYCWLSTIPKSVLTGTNNTRDSTATISDLRILIDDISIDFNCLECSNQGLVELPSTLSLLEASGTVRKLFDTLIASVDSLISDSWMQGEIDLLLDGAEAKCIDGAENTHMNILSLENVDGLKKLVLPRESIESLIFFAIVAFEVFATVTAVEYSTTDGENLISEKVPVPSPFTDGINVFDLSNPGSSGSKIGMLLDNGFDQVVRLLGEMANDSNAADGTDLGINIFLRSIAFGDTDALSIPFDGLSYEVGGTEFSLATLEIRGLDTFTEFKISQVDETKTVVFDFSLDHLDLTLEVEVNMNANSSSMQSDSQSDEKEFIVIDVSAKDINVSLSLMMAIDLDIFEAIELGSVMNSENILPCLLSSMHQFFIPELRISSIDIEEPVISGFVSHEIEEAIAMATETLFNKYKSDVVAAIPTIFESNIRKTLNNMIREYILSSSSSRCPSPKIGKSLWVDLRDLFLNKSEAELVGASGTAPYGDMVPMLKSLLDNQLHRNDPITNNPLVNDLLVRPWTESQSGTPGTLIFNDDVFEASTKIKIAGLRANVQVRLYNVKIDNLDSLGHPLRLIDPVSSNPYSIDNEFIIGHHSNKTLQISAYMLIDFETSDAHIRDVVKITAGVEGAHIVAGLMGKMSEESLLKLSLKEVSNPYCLLATIPAPLLDDRGLRIESKSDATAALTNIDVSVNRVEITTECVECTSPGLFELSDLLSTNEAKKEVTVAMNKLLENTEAFVEGEYAQIAIDRLLNEAQIQCPQSNIATSDVQYNSFSSPEFRNETIKFLLNLAIFIGCSCLVYFSASTTRTWIKKQSNVRWLKSLSYSEINKIFGEQTREKKIECGLNKCTKSLFYSNSIPFAVRILMPFVIVGNVLLFISGHLNLGATVNVFLQIAGEEITIGNFFEFSMYKSTVDMWNAGAKELAIIILVFSGIWPYTKQLISLFLWFAPPSLVGVSLRGSIYLWLDILAKWSMIDIFVLVISIAAFRVTISSPDVAYLTSNLYSVDLMVVPLWGLYANMIAQIVSQVSSHVIIHYHRKMATAAYLSLQETKEDENMESSPKCYAVNLAVGGRMRSETQVVMEVSDYCSESDEKAYGGCTPDSASTEEMNDLCEPLRLHVYQLKGMHEGKMLKARPVAVDTIVGITSASVILLVVLGCSIASFRLEIFGLIGRAVELGEANEQAITRHSIFTIVQLMLDQAAYLDEAWIYIGLISLSVLFIFSSLLAPLLQTVTLLTMWHTPMKSVRRKQIIFLLEILQAWQYVEVYLISIYIASWQLGDVSEFMINDYCGGLSDFFSLMAFYGVLSASDSQCFYAMANIEAGWYVLLIAAFLLAILTKFVVGAAKEQMNEAEKVSNQNVQLVECGSNLDPTNNDFKKDEMIKAIVPESVSFTERFHCFFIPANPLLIEVGVSTEKDAIVEFS